MKTSKKSASLLLGALCVFAPLQLNAAEIREQELGSVQQLIGSLRHQFYQRGGEFSASQSAVDLPVKIQDYFEKDGQISVSGLSAETNESVFYMKGGSRGVTGYLVLLEQKLAYKLETNRRGVVRLRKIPITDVYPDFDENFYRGFDGDFTTLAVSHPVYSPMALRQAAHIGPYNNQDVTRLESKPGSPYVFYLNTTAVMSGSTPLNGVSKEQMYRAWQSVADQYSMLNLNVTTNRSVYDQAKSQSVLRTGIINFINQDGRSYAPLHSFGTTSAGTLFRNPSSGFDYGYGIGMTGAHEVGHQMGMLHDGGGTGGEYFEGIPAFQWGPIMGNYWRGGSWANQLFTWSKGEYNTANNQEDDLRIMTVEESVPYMSDDNPSSKPLLLRANGEINPLDNYGQIERNTDTDTFSFDLTAPGVVNLRVDPIEYLRMLDVQATIYNASNAVVANSNLSVHRSAEFTNLNLPAGSYRVVIKGGAEGTPQNGFSAYSSLGWYAMKGTIRTDGTPPPTDTELTSGVPLANQSASTGQWRYYVIDVPAGSTKLTVNTNGNNGDADLYVKALQKPTATSNDCKSESSNSVESCVINSPSAGRYYVGVYGYASFSALTVTAIVTAGSGDPALSSGVPVNGVSAAKGQWRYFTIVAPAGSSRLDFSITGANGDADLFARQGARPTTSEYGCKSDSPNSNEQCSIHSPSGEYTLGVYAYAAFSNLTVKATVIP